MNRIPEITLSPSDVVALASLLDGSKWLCRYCKAISYSNEISVADGVCSFHPAGVGNHHFEEVAI